VIVGPQLQRAEIGLPVRTFASPRWNRAPPIPVSRSTSVTPCLASANICRLRSLVAISVPSRPKLKFNRFPMNVATACSSGGRTCTNGCARVFACTSASVSNENPATPAEYARHRA
jgi:hypothetical protein